MPEPRTSISGRDQPNRVDFSVNEGERAPGCATGCSFARQLQLRSSRSQLMNWFDGGGPLSRSKRPVPAKLQEQPGQTRWPASTRPRQRAQ